MEITVWAGMMRAEAAYLTHIFDTAARILLLCFINDPHAAVFSRNCKVSMKKWSIQMDVYMSSSRI